RPGRTCCCKGEVCHADEEVGSQADGDAQKDSHDTCNCQRRRAGTAVCQAYSGSWKPANQFYGLHQEKLEAQDNHRPRRGNSGAGEDEDQLSYKEEGAGEGEEGVKED
ncbi:hypothetical protein DFQ27_005433, partial [Actinomortierella ambigua]